MAEETNSENQQKHRQLDPIFKQVIEDEFNSFTEAKLQTEVEVSRLPLKIDALVTVQSEEERRRICQETAFFYFLHSNQIEFKGRNDRLTIRNYHRISGRTKLYLSDHDISIHDMSVTIICASRPQKVIEWAKSFRPFQQVADGYYKNEEYPPVHLIVINELSVVPKNYPLLMFAASERKFREFIEQVVAENDTAHLRYAYEIRPQVTREVLTMTGRFTTLTRTDLEFMADDIGRDLIAVMEPEEMLEGLNEEKQRRLISLFKAKDVLAEMGPEKLLNEMSPEMKKTLLELLLQSQTMAPANEEPNVENHS